MNAQILFDTVITHLLNQKVQSINESANCLYRGPNGTSCAVGCLIPDEMYDKDMDNMNEDSSIAYVVEHFVTPDYFKDHIELLKRLQEIHDQDYYGEGFTKNNSDFMTMIGDVAAEFGLVDKFNV